MRFSLGEQLMRLIRSDSRKILQKICQGMTAIQIIEQCLHQHSRSGKTWRSAHDLRINCDDARFHVTTLAHCQFLASFDSRHRY